MFEVFFWGPSELSSVTESCLHEAEAPKQRKKDSDIRYPWKSNIDTKNDVFSFEIVSPFKDCYFGYPMYPC